MTELKTTIGLEIHIQLKTKSKMFCRCDNQSFAEATDGRQAEAIKPNTLVCPVCLGLPGALPVANKQAILWTVKTGLAINSTIPKIAKFDRKHYFYPDLPKGYQISQYNEPFAVGGELKVKSEKLKGTEEEITIRFNRVHLEEDAGKLIHADGKSLVDLNRAGTPLMEMVTEPDITSPKMAGDFLRRLQKLVRDEVKVSDADMEKGHFRCDANISVSDNKGFMSEIVEIKNLNSFKFVEKALAIEEERLKIEYPNWSEGKKITRGYDSNKDITFVQRNKEEAADYRYFPEPDLPPFDTAEFDLAGLKSEIGESLEIKVATLIEMGVNSNAAKIIATDKNKWCNFSTAVEKLHQNSALADLWAKAVVNNYFTFDMEKENKDKLDQYLHAALDLTENKITKNNFIQMVDLIHSGKNYEELSRDHQNSGIDLEQIICKIIKENSNEVENYRAGKKQLLGFFIGLAMKESFGQADPKEIAELLKIRLDN